MRRADFRRTSLLAATALGLMGVVGLTQAAHASGFGLREGSADWLGNAFVGGEAKAYDASTAWTNPAGMALLDQTQISSNISYIGPSATFKGSNSNPLYGSPLGAGAQANVSGRDGGNAIAPAATGALFGVFVLNPEWRLGFSVTNPYGERTSYNKSWVGRYQSLVSSITGIDFSPSLSYKVNNHFSIGAGPVFEYFDARLTQAINTPLGAATGQDPTGDMHGDNVGFGYNIGLLYAFDDATRIGIDYHSRIKHSISGTQAMTVPASYYEAASEGGATGQVAGATIQQIESQNGGARTSITLPDSLGASLYHQVTPALALMGSVQWTDWSLFKQLRVTPDSGAPGLVIQENWRNTWFAGVGANYQVDDSLMLQTGFSFDESPVTNANRTPRVPDANHYNLGFGLKYKLTPSTTFGLAYLHVFTPGGTINSTALPTGYQQVAPGVNIPASGSGALTGSYAASDNSVTAGVNVVF